MAAAGLVARHRDSTFKVVFSKELHVAAGICLTVGGPLIEVRQLHSQHRRLDRVEPTVDADQIVVIPRLHAVDPQQFELGGDVVAGGGEEAAVTGSTEILGGVETEAADITKTSGAFPMPGRED